MTCWLQAALQSIIEMVESVGAEVVGLAFLIELDFFMAEMFWKDITSVPYCIIDYRR